MTFVQLFKIILVGAIWGGSHAMVRVTAPAIGPTLTAFIRILIAASFLWMLLRFRKKNLDIKTNWTRFLVAGVLNLALPQFLLAFGALHLPAAYLSIVNGMVPAFIAIFSYFILRESLSARKSIGLFMGLFGVVLLSQYGSVEHFDSDTWIALAESLAATASYGIGTVYVRRWASHIKPAVLTSGGGFAGALVLAPMALIAWLRYVPEAAPVHSSAVVIGCLFTLGILGSGIAFVLFYGLVREVGAFRASITTFLMPMFGMLWGFLFLGEGVTLGMIGGAALVLFSTALCLKRESMKIVTPPVFNPKTLVESRPFASGE